MTTTVPALPEALVDRRAANPLLLGDRPIWPPVVLAPMAGITNAAYRRLCREYGAGLYVCEMVTTRALVERTPKTLDMAHFAADESPRSLQLYGVDPYYVGKAVEMVLAEDMADHVDLNFGCPVPKVTRKGGGSALPWKRELFRLIVRSAVSAAQGRIPITVKIRKGIDDDHLTYLDAARTAQDEGVCWVSLHGRTAADMYSGHADWEAIATLKASVSIPVLGNGDIWEATDAMRMMEQTGCDGVVVGRGCLGRPWLFRSLAAAFDGAPYVEDPPLAEVTRVLRRHAELLTELMGEDRALRDLRKHTAWYLKGFSVGGAMRAAASTVSTLAELDAVIAMLDLDQPFPATEVGRPRGRAGSPRRVILPEGWLADRDDVAVPEGAELADSGG